MSKDKITVYTDVTPIMTSNNTPSPYVVSASSIYSNMDVYQCWKAFNNTNTDYLDLWVLGNGESSGWIQIDLSVKTKIDAFDLECRSTETTSSPNTFKLLGSNDGNTFNTIKEFADITDWQLQVRKRFILDSVENYRYYRIEITKNNGNTYTGLSNIRFLKGSTYIPENSNSINLDEIEFPIGIVEKEDLTELASELTEGEEQLLITRDGKLYLTNGQGSYTSINDNKEILDLISKDEQGNLLFNGKPISTDIDGSLFVSNEEFAIFKTNSNRKTVPRVTLV